MNNWSSEINSTTSTNLGSETGFIANLGSLDSLKQDKTVVSAAVVAAPSQVPVLNDILDVFRTIGTFSWSNSVSTHSMVCWGLYKNLPNIDNMYISQYQYFRGSPTIRITYTGSSAVQGVCRIFMVPVRETDNSSYCVPETNLDDYTTLGYNQYPRSASMPHVDLDASVSCVCELAVPYVSAHDFGLTNANNDYTIFFQPLSTLVRADTTAPPTLTINIEVKYPDLSFLNLVKQGGDASALSSLMAYAKRFAGTYISPAVAIARSGVKIAESMGFSRPPDEDLKQVVTRGYTNMAAMSGADDGAIHLGVDPRQMANMADGDIPGEELNDFGKFINKRNNFMIPYHALYPGSYCLTPDTFPQTFGSVLEYPTPMCLLSLLHTSWRGSLIVKITFYSTPLIRTRVGVNIFPPNVSVSGTFVSNGSVIAKIVEICGTTVVEIPVPFMYAEKSVPVRGLNHTSANGPRLAFFILEGPNGPSASAPNPGIMIDLLPGEDLEFTRPTLKLMNEYLVAQGRLSESVGEDIKSFRELVKRSSCLGVFGPGTGSTVTQSNVIAIPVVPPPLLYGSVYEWNNGTAANTMSWEHPSWTFLSFLNAISLGSRGSTTLRIVTYSDNTTIEDPIFVFNTETYLEIGSTSMVTGTGALLLDLPSTSEGIQYFQHGTVAANIPDYCQMRYKPNNVGAIVTTKAVPVQSLVCGIWPVVPSAGVKYFTSYSAGDDTRFGFYMPPCLSPRT